MRMWVRTALAIAILCIAQPGHAFSIDWSSIGWDPNDASGSQSFNNVDGSGIDIQVDYTDNMFGGPPEVYDVPTLPADINGTLRFTTDMDGGDGLQPTTVTINFSEAVLIDLASLVSLSIILDTFQEHGLIQAFDAAGAPVNATTYATTDPAEAQLDVDGDANYETIGLLSQSDGRYGDALVSYTGIAISSISFSLWVTEVGGEDLVAGFGSAGVGNVTFSTVPEPGVLLMMGSGLAGLATLGRRRR